MECFVDYDRIAKDAAVMLRLEAGCNSHDEALIALVGELSTRSELFCTAGPPTTCSSTALAASDSAARSRQLDVESLVLVSAPGLARMGAPQTTSRRWTTRRPTAAGTSP